MTELAGSVVTGPGAGDLLHLANEQAALRHVATLVAQRATPTEVFAAVARESAHVLDVALTSVVRYEGGKTALQVGASGHENPFEVGTRWMLDDLSVSAQVLRTGRAARVDDYSDVGGEIAMTLRAVGIRSAVGAPIVVDGRVWGVLMALSAETRPLPAGTESRLAAFTELIATSISNTDARERLRRVAEEQAALRRVATLVAVGAAAEDVLDAVAAEAAAVIGVPVISIVRADPDGTATKVGGWGESPFPLGSRWELVGDTTVMAAVIRSGRPERVDDYSQAGGAHAKVLSGAGIRSGLGVPIVVNGRTWGAIVALSPEPPAEHAEARLADFTDIAAIAIGNAEARAELSRSEALHRSAIAQAGAIPYAVEYGTGRYTFMGEGIEALTGYRPDELTRERFESLVLETHDHGTHSDLRIQRRDGELRWAGDVSVEVLAEDGRAVGSIGMLQDITERIAAEEDLRRAQDEQAALRRVATLVAREASPTEVFDAVAAEVAHVLEIPLTSILSYDVGETAIKVGGSGVENPYPVGARFPPEPGVIMEVGRTGRPARVDDYGAIQNDVAQRLASAGIRSSVGVPIVVNGRTWGVMVALTTAVEPLPADTEDRLADFTELVATAIANAEARAELRQLADEQSALRRVATLVAGGSDARGVFDAVCEETGLLIGATSVNLCRFTSDGFNLTMAGWSLHDTHVPTGTRLPLEGETINNIIRRSGAPTRVDNYAGVAGELAALIRERGIQSEIGAPVIVEGAVWGALIAGWDGDDLCPPGTELRLANFAELIATAVSNTSNRAELVASRARIVASADDARRRIERDLHDGTQQQLVALGLDLKALEMSLPPDRERTHADLERLRKDLDGVLENVREISQGVHPATLSQWGVGPAVRTLARRSVVPTELEIHVSGRLPQSVEIAAYYAVSEALANVAKHAQASHARVELRVTDDQLEATIQDDGIGGADTARGSGLIGLVDRVEALGGHLSLSSPRAEGTLVSVTLPLDA